MNNYSIFHTSHCGSTLLAGMLSESLPTLTEPDWSHRIHKHPGKKNTIEFINSNLTDNTLVKYSSAFCYVAPFVAGKKVFLYRTLQSHLEKMISNSNYLINNLDFVSEVLKCNFHKDLGYNYENLPYHDKLLTHALLWVDRYLHLKDCDDVLMIDSNNFLTDRVKTAQKICDYFDVEFKCPDILLNTEIDAKSSMFNHNSTPLNIKTKNVVGYVPRKISKTNPLFIKTKVEMIKSKYPFIPNELIYNT